MATRQQVECWLDQAEADRRAGSADAPAAECHRRYWFQQAYEKAIKAVALMRWAGPDDDHDFQAFVVFEHSPLDRLTREHGDGNLSKPLWLLSRELEVLVRGVGQQDVLLQVDATRPSRNPEKVSYRYPFVHEGEFVAPCAFGHWDEVQGGSYRVSEAVRLLIKAARTELKVWARKPG